MHARERAPYDILRARDIAYVRQRIAEQRRIARLGSGVPRRVVEAAFEQLDGLLRPAGRGIRPPELRVDVHAVGRLEGQICDRGLEVRNGAEHVLCSLAERGERDSGAKGNGAVGDRDGVDEDIFEAVLHPVRFPEPDGELEVGEPQLARPGRIELRAGLEEVGGDAELRRELPQRFHRRLPGSGLDSGDIRVRDPRSGQLPLGQAALQPEALEPLPDGLARARSGLGRHLNRIVVALCAVVDRAAPVLPRSHA